MNCETKGTDSGEPEPNPDRGDEAQGYVDQLHDRIDLFDNPPPAQSLQRCRKPPSTDSEEGATIENENAMEHDSAPPSIASS